MRSIVDPILDGVDALLAWFSTELGQTVESYCDLETAEDKSILVARDGSLVSIIRIRTRHDNFNRSFFGN